MKELDERTDDWNDSRVEKEIRIGRYVAKRRKIRKKELSIIKERRAIENDVFEIAYRFIVMKCTERGGVKIKFGRMKNLTVLSARLIRYTKDLMMRTRGDREDKNESEDIARRHDCESDKIRKELKSNVKMNCRALIIA
ncbi:hypothetical protein QTP88_000129 [Uroleucon formosanum]